MSVSTRPARELTATAAVAAAAVTATEEAVTEAAEAEEEDSFFRLKKYIKSGIFAVRKGGVFIYLYLRIFHAYVLF